MRFVSQIPNLDPEPWIDCLGDRTSLPWTDSHGHSASFDPRPEFEPTRDPEPFQCVNGTRLSKMPRDQICRCIPLASHPHVVYRRPRREHYDTPVNRILTDFRRVTATYTKGRCRNTARQWVEDLAMLDWSSFAFDPTPDEVDHAIRVLERLATRG